MKELLLPLLGTAIRHGLTIAGGAGLAVSDGLVNEVASAIAILAGVVLSVVKARKAK